MKGVRYVLRVGVLWGAMGARRKSRVVGKYPEVCWRDTPMKLETRGYTS